MKLEHVAINVPDPAAMAQWYADNLGMKIALATAEPPYMHFLSDQAGSMIELYHNTTVEMPDYTAMHPQILHFAFATDDMAGDRQRLIDAGAAPFDEIVTTPRGDKLVFLRDPWGVPVQLVQRSKPIA